jgi:hypothetical protein
MVMGSSANWQVEQVKLTPEITWRKFPKSIIQGGGDDPSILPPSLGVVNNANGSPQLPTPADLARADQIPGKSLTLADGHRWLVPNARIITEFGGVVCNLKSSFDLDDETGDWIRGQVLPQYRKIWDHATAYVDSRNQAIEKAEPGELVSWEIPDWQRMVVDALQVNYRVSARELATLGVLVTGLAQDVAKVLIDEEGYAKLKKKEEAGIGAG